MNTSPCPLAASNWIGAEEAAQSPVIIRRFPAENVKKATLHVTGLGYFEAKVNGQPVCEERFIPVVSDYGKRDLTAFLYPLHDETTNAVYYYEYDVTALLAEGDNELTIQLGNGFYRQMERNVEGLVHFPDPFTCNAGSGSAPSGVQGADDTGFGIGEQNGHAVGGFDRDGQPRYRGDVAVTGLIGLAQITESGIVGGDGAHVG